MSKLKKFLNILIAVGIFSTTSILAAAHGNNTICKEAVECIKGPQNTDNKVLGIKLNFSSQPENSEAIHFFIMKLFQAKYADTLKKEIYDNVLNYNLKMKDLQKEQQNANENKKQNLSQLTYHHVGTETPQEQQARLDKTKKILLDDYVDLKSTLSTMNKEDFDRFIDQIKKNLESDKEKGYISNEDCEKCKTMVSSLDFDKVKTAIEGSSLEVNIEAENKQNNTQKN